MSTLKRHRLSKGWTQRQLASKVGRTHTAVSLWESGKSLPDPDIFPKLARVLGIPPLELTKVIEPGASELASAGR